jgi:prepilin-type N-terminal cleavage/methylation domain-containing protein
MKQHNRHKSGVTLVELLVVLAIIAILTTATIPIMSQLGAFSSNRNQGAARDLFTILKATQIYASTHNTDTAVIYYPRDFTDSWTDGSSPALDSYMVVRRIKVDELIQSWTYYDFDSGQIVNGLLRDNIRQFLINHYATDLNINDESLVPFADEVFIPIRNAKDQFREFPRDTCMLLRPNPEVSGFSDALPETEDDPFLDFASFSSNTGMTRVLVFNPWIVDGNGELSGDLLYPPSNPEHGSFQAARLRYGDGDELEAYWDVYFPGHVFTPTGEVLRNNSFTTKERVTLYLGADPNRIPDDRFFENPDQGGNFDSSDPFLRDASGDLIPLQTEVKLFLTTGRPKVES